MPDKMTPTIKLCKDCANCNLTDSEVGTSFCELEYVHAVNGTQITLMAAYAARATELMCGAGARYFVDLSGDTQ